MVHVEVLREKLGVVLAVREPSGELAVLMVSEWRQHF